MASVLTNTENVRKTAHNALKLSGKRFSNLVVISYAGSKLHPGGSSHSTWLCRCDCGKEIIAHGTALTSGNSKSCGYIPRKNTTKRNTTHGLSKTPCYIRWQGMLNRCRNKNAIGYNNYGGRGISVCERWSVYSNFIEDMGYPPTKLHSLERIDNNSGYEPGNCKWATKEEQSRNKRSNRIISFNGKSQALIDWAKDIGIDQASLRERLSKWSIEDALLKPKRRTA